jgi:hypothetical protein
MAEFNLSDIFHKSFGYEAPKPMEIPKASPRIETSSLGQPYYLEDLSGREFFMPVKLNDYLLPFAVIGMTWKKTFVETAMPERGGSVTELISIDDYVFTIKGILINSKNVFPESEVIDLHKLFKINASISLRSVLSDIVLDGAYDHKVIVKQITWPAVAGVEHAKPFEMELKSDMIFDLEID